MNARLCRVAEVGVRLVVGGVMLVGVVPWQKPEKLLKGALTSCRKANITIEVKLGPGIN